MKTISQLNIVAKANSNKPEIPRPWYSFRAQADSTEILIYDQIGRDYWTGAGIDAKEFMAQLDRIPKGQQITVGINSPGGNVVVGLSIYNALQRRKEDITTRCDGIAASIASCILCSGSKAICPSNAMVMVHNPSGVCEGDSEDMEKAAEALKVFAKSMATIYSAKTGKTEKEMLKMMDAETWLNAQDAKECGMVDAITDPIEATALCKHDLSAFGHVPAGIGSIGASATQNPRKEPHMEPNPTTAAVAQTPTAQATQPPPTATQAVITPTTAATIDVTAILAELAEMREAARRAPIVARVDAAISSNRLPQQYRDFAIEAALKDIKTLEKVEATEPMPGVSDPSPRITTISADWRNVRDSICAHFGKRDLEPKARQELALARAMTIRKERKKLEDVLAFTNTIDTDLQVNTILNIVIDDFARSLAPLTAFSTNIGSVQLNGTDIVVVRYYALDTTASNIFSTATGYVADNTATSERKITVDKRIWQGLGYTSSDLARQPYFSTVDLMRQKVAKLGYDIWADICSIILSATYTQTPMVRAGADFTSNDLVSLAGQADDLYWPSVPGSRSFICKTAYKTALLQETIVKTANAIGTTEPVQEAKLRHISGFDIYGAPLLPTNSQNLGAFAAFKSAILIAMAPITPAPSVMALTYRYETIVHPETGMTLEFREIGNQQNDTGGMFVEANYGKVAGEAKALIRVTTA